MRRFLRSLAATRYSVVARLLIGVLLFSSFVALTLTAIQLYADYRHDVADIEARLDRLSSESLAEGLWTLDERQLRLQLDAILQLPDISGAEIREAGSTGNVPLLKLGRDSEKPLVVREYPLRHKVEGQDRVIGTLRVEATLANVYRRLASTASTILVTQAVTILLVSLFVLYFFHRLVTRHLSAIAADVGSHRIVDAPLAMHLQRSPPRHEDELQRVVTALNTLSQNLHIAYRDLAEREAKIRRLVDANIIGVLIWDFDGRIIEANDAFLQIVGYEREDFIAGRLRWTDLTPPEWHERDAVTIREHNSTGRALRFEKEYLRRDGSRVPVLIGAATFEDGGSHGVAFVLDLTDRKRAEAALREAQAALARVNRVTTLGVLAASIAHEVNQPLGAMVTSAASCSRWLAAQPPDFDKAQRALERIGRDGRRAGEVIDRIRTLVQRQAPRTDPLDINEAIEEVLALTRDEMQRNEISLGTSLARGLPPVEGDRVQLQQVILNLVVNAIEAMSAVADQRREVAVRSAKDGGAVLVEVRDSGPGVDPERVDQLFEAFYTTKAEGIGMGLSISHSIIEAHGGRLWAGPNEPHGAAFQFSLPAALTTSIACIGGDTDNEPQR
ncbi:MAG TPA: ATP-binding protein [Bradyrhizobium sp.]|nr:ATP-binding protein [Bradyrhizobium sp.]